ncbi:iron-sulfur cluster assembly accessory protein [Pseudoxanthobacter sp.]|uniref:HesB/IscA family protein n=1 Tax=Pseudoxanthobacter sp. TaxID=1925742 RepID=UPI002FE069F7
MTVQSDVATTRAARPRRRIQVMSLTAAAEERVREILDNADLPHGGLRVGVRNGGCAGMSYTMDVVAAPGAGDEVIAFEGGQVFVDPKAVLFLLGTTMDFRVTKLSATFAFDNPNQVSACGCGESVSLKAADPGALDG